MCYPGLNIDGLILQASQVPVCSGNLSSHSLREERNWRCSYGQKGSEGHNIWRTPFSPCASLESMLFLWQTLQWVSGSTRWANKIFFYLKELEESLQNRWDRCGGQKFKDDEIRPLSQNKNRNKKIQGRWIPENWFRWHKIKFRKHAFFFFKQIGNSHLEI